MPLLEKSRLATGDPEGVSPRSSENQA